MSVSSKHFLDVQATAECRFTLKRVGDMKRTHSQPVLISGKITWEIKKESHVSMTFSSRTGQHFFYRIPPVAASVHPIHAIYSICNLWKNKETNCMQQKIRYFTNAN